METQGYADAMSIIGLWEVSDSVLAGETVPLAKTWAPVQPIGGFPHLCRPIWYWPSSAQLQI